LPSDVEKIEEFLDDFERVMKELDDKGNDYVAVCNYEGWVECIIREANEQLYPAPAHDACWTAGVKELRPMWIQISGKIADATCQYERDFYGHLKWYLSRRSKQCHGRVLLSELNEVKEFLDNFEKRLKSLNDKGNDYDDIRVYGSLIEDTIKDAKGKLSLVN
jgi:PHP family Zn ribbon phosphoesterase